MGDDPAVSVVTKDGPAHGAPNLAILGASTVPSTTSDNSTEALQAHARRSTMETVRIQMDGRVTPIVPLPVGTLAPDFTLAQTPVTVVALRGLRGRQGGHRRAQRRGRAGNGPGARTRRHPVPAAGLRIKRIVRRSNAMPIIVDLIRCQSDGQCVFAAPTVFRFSGEHALVSGDRGPGFAFGPNDALREQVERAVAATPLGDRPWPRS